MRAICVGDIHGDIDAVHRLRDRMSPRDFDYVFLLGDYSRGFRDPEENRCDIQTILEAFRGYKVWALPGNCDQTASVRTLQERGTCLHNRVLKLPEATIIGLGGSNVTPFGTPFEQDEVHLTRALEGLSDSVEKHSRVILMTHTPPKDTRCDAIAGGHHVGSTAVRRYIETWKPELALCAHIHEAGGEEDRIGETRVVNLGRLPDCPAWELTAADYIDIKPYNGLK